MRFIGYSLLLAASLLPFDRAAARDGLRVLHSDARSLEVEWTLSTCELETVSGADGTYRRPSFAGSSERCSSTWSHSGDRPVPSRSRQAWARPRAWPQ